MKHAPASFVITSLYSLAFGESRELSEDTEERNRREEVGVHKQPGETQTKQESKNYSKILCPTGRVSGKELWVSTSLSSSFCRKS